MSAVTGRLPALPTRAILRIVRSTLNLGNILRRNPMSNTENIEVVISFDTTGSMYPVLTQVRRNVEDVVNRLFREIPNIRIGVITHGCANDGPPRYQDLTDTR